MLQLSDKHYAVLNCAVRSLGRVALGAVVARAAGPSGFSAYVLLVTTEVILATLSNARYALPMLTVAPAVPPDRRFGFEAFVLCRLARSTTIAAGVGVLCAPLLAPLLGVGIGTIVLFLLAVAFSVMANGARAQRQSGFNSATTLLPDMFAAALPIGNAGAWLGMRQRVSASALSPPSEELRRRFEALGPPFAVGSAMNSATMRTHPYLLGSMAGAVQLGMLGAAASLIGPIRLVSGALSAVLRPRLSLHHSGHDELSARRVLRHAIGLQGALGAFALAIVVGNGELVAMLVFGEKFTAVGSLLPVAVVFASLEGIGASLTVDLQTRSEDGARESTRARLASGLLALGSVPLLCPQFGALGSLLAMALGELAFSVALWFRWFAQEPKRVRSIL